MKTKLPNFLLVGAAKSGTTSLYNYLNQHPDIFMPKKNKDSLSLKEPQYLVKEKVKKRLHFGVWSWEEYRQLFNKSIKSKAIGEASVFYLYFYNEAIKNIKFRLGNEVKIIILLRNPIYRAYSAFLHVSRGKQENYSFEEALSLEESRLKDNPFLTPMVMYKDMGLYYNMVRAYKKSFKNLHVILYEDLINKTEDVLKETFSFLDIDNNFTINYNKKYNVGGKVWRSPFLKNLLSSENAIKRLVPSFIKRRLRKNLFDFSTKKADDMDAKTKESLKSFYKNDVIKLSKLIGRDLNHWLK